MKLKDIKKGDYFVLTNISFPNESQVFVKGDYDFSERCYVCHAFNDINKSRCFKGSKTVFQDFSF